MRAGIVVLLAVCATACTTAPIVDDDALDEYPEGAAQLILETDVAPIFNRSCLFASHCHSAINYSPTTANGCRGGLALEDAALGSQECPALSLHQRLLALRSEQCLKPTALVKPCAPEGSYLFRKLGGGPLCDGDPMPLDGVLEEHEIAIIRSWIATGAASLNSPAVDCSRER